MCRSERSRAGGRVGISEIRIISLGSEGIPYANELFVLQTRPDGTDSLSEGEKDQF